MKQEHWIAVAVIALILGFGGVLYIVGGSSGADGSSRTPEQEAADLAKAALAPLGPLAQCLKDKGAIFYGAFWCSHCQNQKRAFGDAAPLIPYVECSTPDSRGIYPVCSEANIESFPTWVFADGTRQSGEISIADLATKTGCPIPEGI